MNFLLCFGVVPSDLALYPRDAFNDNIFSQCFQGVRGARLRVVSMRFSPFCYIIRKLSTGFLESPQTKKEEHEMIYMRKSCCTTQNWSLDNSFVLHFNQLLIFALIAGFCTRILCLFDFNLMIHPFTGSLLYH